MRPNGVKFGSIGSTPNTNHGSFYNGNTPSLTHQWSDYSLTHNDKVMNSQVVFPSDEITNETIRRENKLREKKLNDLKQFNDLYEYLNTKNKNKSSNMSKPTKKTRNKLKIALRTEENHLRDSTLKPIKETEEPDSG